MPEYDGLIDVPGHWNKFNFSDGTSFSANGYGTYRMLIKTNASNESLAIKIGEVSTACCMYIDGKLAYECGTVSTNAEAYTPRSAVGFASFDDDQPVHEIIIQVANYKHRNGGLWNEIYIGTTQNILTYTQSSLTLQLFLIGGMFFVALFCMVLFILRKNMNPLLCAIYGIAVLLRSCFITEIPINIFFQDIPWDVTYMVQYLMLFLTIPCSVHLAHNLFPQHVHKWLPYSSWFISLVLGIIVLVFPPSIYTWTAVVYQLGAIIYMHICAALLARTLFEKDRSTMLMAIGLALMAVASTTETLALNDILHLGRILQIIFFAWGYAAAISVTFSFSEYFISIERHRERLELQVIGRTKDAEASKEKALHANEMMSNFLALMSHEIRTPLNGLIGLNQLLLDTSLTPIQQEYASSMDESGKQLLALLSDVLEFTKLEQLSFKIDNSPFYLNDLISYIVNIYTPII